MLIEPIKTITNPKALDPGITLCTTILSTIGKTTPINIAYKKPILLHYLRRIAGYDDVIGERTTDYTSSSNYYVLS